MARPNGTSIIYHLLIGRGITQTNKLPLGCLRQAGGEVVNDLRRRHKKEMVVIVINYLNYLPTQVDPTQVDKTVVNMPWINPCPLPYPIHPPHGEFAQASVKITIVPTHQSHH